MNLFILAKLFLRRRSCRSCNAVFWICSHCDRGQRYCSAFCRDAVISEVPRDEQIIATGSASTGCVAGESGCARMPRHSTISYSSLPADLSPWLC